MNSDRNFSGLMNYWCSWGVQNFSAPDGVPLPADWIRPVAKLSEARIFGPGGWTDAIPPDVRGRLILLLDVGWDISPSDSVPGPGPECGAMIPDWQRFPSCAGKEPAAALAELSRLTRSHGWGGLGLWIACHALGETAERKLTDDERRAYFRERLQWSAAAGIDYWKVDCGLFCGETSFREMVSEEAAIHAPAICIEHAEPSEGANSYLVPWDTPEVKAGPRTGRFADSRLGHTLRHAQELFPISDVIRTYDVTFQLSFATTMDRASELLAAAQKRGCRAVLNLEDEVILSAVLGCAFGVMRHPDFVEESAADYDPLNVRLRLAEVRAALLWQELAPPFAAGIGNFLRADELLADSHRFVRPDESWNVALYDEPDGVVQYAPAILSRGLSTLPIVSVNGEVKPFVAASHFPGGALAVGVFERWIGNGAVEVPAEVIVNPDREVTALGVFGKFRQVVIAGRAGSLDTLICKNLNNGQYFDPSPHVRVNESGALILDGGILERPEMAAPDKSAPALCFVLK